MMHRQRPIKLRFLSSNTQDFIEVLCSRAWNWWTATFLSSNTQDFIEVGSPWKNTLPMSPIPEL